ITRCISHAARLAISACRSPSNSRRTASPPHFTRPAPYSYAAARSCSKIMFRTSPISSAPTLPRRASFSVRFVKPEMSANTAVPGMDLARRQMAALDELPRPTLVTCRTGGRSAAVIYLYAGLQAGASAEEVLARAEADGAPFVRSEELVAWVEQGLIGRA